MTDQQILDSIIFVVTHENMADDLRKKFAETPELVKKLRYTTIIQLENKIDGAKMQSCTGIDIALCILAKEPNRRIILYHFMPMAGVRFKNKKADLLLSKPNVRFIEAPFAYSDLMNIFEEKGISISTDETIIAMELETKSVLSGIWHDIGKAIDPFSPKPGKETQLVQSGIEKAKEYFPMLADKDDTSILNFLKDASADRELVMKGQKLNGLFCDIEGTLFSNGVLNAHVLATIKQNEAEGKEITLWTDGNLTELQALLDANKITYPLRAKRDFAGAVVEMAIDDMDEHSFSALTKVYAERFIRAQDL